MRKFLFFTTKVHTETTGSRSVTGQDIKELKFWILGSKFRRWLNPNYPWFPSSGQFYTSAKFATFRTILYRWIRIISIFHHPRKSSEKNLVFFCKIFDWKLQKYGWKYSFSVSIGAAGAYNKTRKKSRVILWYFYTIQPKKDASRLLLKMHAKIEKLGTLSKYEWVPTGASVGARKIFVLALFIFPTAYEPLSFSSSGYWLMATPPSFLLLC